MEMNLKKYLKAGDLLRSRMGKAVASSICLAIVLYAAATCAPIVKIGAHSTTYTYSDIQEVYSFSSKVAALGPRGSKVVTSRDAVFQSLIVAGIEKEILDARKMPQADQERATMDILANSPYGGLLAEERERIGEERFYKLFIMPVLVDREFGRYYFAKDPGRATAESVLRVAQDSGIAVAAGKAGTKVKRSLIPVTKETAQLVEEARKAVGSVMPKFVEDASGYAILHVVEITETQLVSDIVFVPRQPISAFVQNELKEAKIPVKDYFYSWFRISRLKEAGGVLSVAQEAKAAVTKEGE